MVEMERSDWTDLRQESSKENEAPDISDSDSTDVALRQRNMAYVSLKEKRMTTTAMRMGHLAMGVSMLEHRRNEEILEEARCGTGSDGYEKDKVGMVRARQKNRLNRKQP